MGEFKINQKIRITKLTGISAILGTIVIFICILIAISDAPWFRWTHNALSDLGAEGASAIFFNSGLIIGGLLIFIFSSIGLALILSEKGGAFTLAISSIALIGIGIYPVTIYKIHFFFSVIFFIFLTLSLFILGFSLRKEKSEKPFGIAAIFFTMIACSSTIFSYFFEGIAITETIVVFPAFLWIIIYGVKMAVQTTKDKTL